MRWIAHSQFCVIFRIASGVIVNAVGAQLEPILPECPNRRFVARRVERFKSHFEFARCQYRGSDDGRIFFLRTIVGKCRMAYAIARFFVMRVNRFDVVHHRDDLAEIVLLRTNRMRKGIGYRMGRKPQVKCLGIDGHIDAPIIIEIEFLLDIEQRQRHRFELIGLRDVIHHGSIRPLDRHRIADVVVVLFSA